MPCIYAHDTFGKKVARQLPENLQHIIKQYPEEFRIGLQGPDFLFFYHPLIKLRTNQIGYWQHGQTMSAFLKSTLPFLRKRGTNHGTYAYLLGFICHFALDRECHSYVIPKSEQPGYNHLVMENEFDRYLLRKDGFLPITFPVWEIIPDNKEISEAIFHAYRPLHLSKKKIRRALKGMRFYKRLLTCGYSLKRFLIRLLMKITFHYAELEGHMMTLKPKKYAGETNRHLQKCYNKALPLAVNLIQDFHLSATTGKSLNERFSTTFKNNQMEKPE